MTSKLKSIDVIEHLAIEALRGNEKAIDSLCRQIDLYRAWLEEKQQQVNKAYQIHKDV